MEKGAYTGRRVYFGKYAAAVFNPYLFSSDFRARLGCGASALALLSGVLPEVIARQNRYQAHFADAFMVRFLRRRRFTALPLTQCNLSTSVSLLGKAHVVLLSQLFRKNEATWGVIFNGIYYHNFELYYLYVLSFLNKPILSAYLIFHMTWRLNPSSKDKPTYAPKTGMGEFTLHKLYGSQISSMAPTQGSINFQ